MGLVNEYCWYGLLFCAFVLCLLLVDRMQLTALTNIMVAKEP